MSKKHDYVKMPFEAFGSCRDVDEFEKLNRIGEGTYGTVYRARDKKSGEIVALKRVILHNEKQDGFPITAIREIKLLKRLHQENCVQLKDVVVGRKRSSVFLVFEYCEHDLSALMTNVKRPFTESEYKRILVELLRAIQYLHQHNIIHRDLKLSNILYDGFGRVKLADFGLARETAYPMEMNFTPKVVTLWYRAPELLLGTETYTAAVDMWAIGCIFGELVLNEPLMNGATDLEQYELITKLLGRPTERIWPGMHSLPHADKFHSTTSSNYNCLSLRFGTQLSTSARTLGLDLLHQLLTYDPKKRLSASEALKHPYFHEKPFPKDIGMMPTFPSQHPDMQKNTSMKTKQDAKFGMAFGRPIKRTRYLKAIQLYPQGPWKSVADYIGTRTARQTQTHAQKHREKLSRRRRGLLRKRATSDEWIDEYSSSPTPSSNPETNYPIRRDVPPLVVSTHQMPQITYQHALEASYPHAIPADDGSMKYSLPNPPSYVYQEHLRHDPYPYVTTYTNDARTIASYHPIDQYTYTTTSTHEQTNEPSRNQPPPALDEMLMEYFGDDIRRHSTTSLQ
ncbi:hypothetical protein THRCLA_09607 [Thraustotheca clavata]|uniref:Cyclin-dependent kinase 2 homolog n=1 Tax=Thraustotheca clavata TaxID=74557 RepID=A0A1V9YV83_9STRA|nr:hypothetical protein THRCLA_09607 [Thraustotheca clavata]